MRTKYRVKLRRAGWTGGGAWRAECLDTVT